MLSNNTPFAAERTLLCDKNGSDVWLVAVKGTFLIKSDGSTEIADQQEEVLQVPKHRGDPSSSSLLYESDLDYTKPATDIILHGHAYGQKGKPTTMVDITMKVATISKTLRVFGDRIWERGLTDLRMSSPKPFVNMSVIYESAFGGIDQKSSKPEKHGWEQRNPVGIGFAMDPDHLQGTCVPNVEYPNELICSWSDRPRPAGFGPIARHWSPRVTLAGTYDEQWENERFPLLPNDFNERFFQYSPEDQQIGGYLRGNEMVELHNLSPDGLIRFSLPRIALGFRTRLGEKSVEHRANLHSVIIEPDVPRVIMVWHSMLPCHGKKYSLEGTSIFQKRVL